MVALPPTVYSLNTATSYSGTPDYAAYFADVLRALKGEPNLKRSSNTEWRYGTQGSVAADLINGRWYDHEHEVGGGVLDFIARERKCDVATAAEWFEENYQRAGPKPVAALRAQRQSTSTDKADGAAIWAGGDPWWLRHVTAHYDYREPDGSLRLRVFRVERQGEAKTFRQATQRADGIWVASAEGVEHVPYRLFELRAKVPHDQVFVAEGEKDVDRLASLGFVATCNAGGANKWPDELTEHFRGCEVYIIEDNDDSGRKHARMVARKLHGVAEAVRVVALPDLPPKGDVSDWLDAGGKPEQLLDIAQTAPLWQPGAGDDWDAPRSATYRGPGSAGPGSGPASNRHSTMDRGRRGSDAVPARIRSSGRACCREQRNRASAHHQAKAARRLDGCAQRVGLLRRSPRRAENAGAQ